MSRAQGGIHARNEAVARRRRAERRRINVEYIVRSFLLAGSMMLAIASPRSERANANDVPCPRPFSSPACGITSSGATYRFVTPIVHQQTRRATASSKEAGHPAAILFRGQRAPAIEEALLAQRRRTAMSRSKSSGPARMASTAGSISLAVGALITSAAR